MFEATRAAQELEWVAGYQAKHHDQGLSNFRIGRCLETFLLAQLLFSVKKQLPVHRPGKMPRSHAGFGQFVLGRHSEKYRPLLAFEGLPTVKVITSSET